MKKELSFWNYLGRQYGLFGQMYLVVLIFAGIFFGGILLALVACAL